MQKRILYIASVRIPNEKASALAIMRQCEAFADLGHSVTLLRPYRQGYRGEDPFELYGVERKFAIKTMFSLDFYEALGKFGFYCARLSQMLYSFGYVLFMRKHIDIVYTRDPWMVCLTLFLMPRICVFFEGHMRYGRNILRGVVVKADRVIVISEGLKSFYEKQTGRTGIMVEPSGVYLPQFDTGESVSEARDMFGLPLSKTIVSYIGKYTTMGEEKGVEQLLAAFARLGRKDQTLHMLLVGLEVHESEIVKERSVSLGIGPGRITMLPLVQKHFASYVRASDVLVMNYPPTEHFSLYMSPTKLFAYMAGRRIVVTTDLPSVREIVDETMVFFARTYAEDDLEEALLECLAKKLKHLEMILRARQRVEYFSWINRAKRILGA